MKRSSILLRALWFSGLFAGAIHLADPTLAAGGPSAVSEPPRTFALETFARRNLNYLGRMVDTNGLPYFNVFWTDPAEAAHDWPDFGDVMARQFQAVIMARNMTGERVPIEAVWRRKLLELIDPETGLLTRPQTTFSQKVADPGDQALTLYALVTAYADAPDESLKRTILKMTASLLAQAEKGTGGGDGFLSRFIIKSLMASVRVLHDDNALKLAGKQIHRVFVESPLFSPDNTFRHGGHMHGNLRTLVGAADYALYARDPVLFSRVDALYRYVRSKATSFGFMPEVIGRQGDVVATETCALMDYVGLAVTLANHGHLEYWGDVERVVRNQLAESQATDLTWLKPAPEKPDTEQFTWRDLAERLKGGYAGWSSPTHFLATCETLHWGGPELRGKTRVFQNCCGGSGTHGFFIAWKNAASFENGTLSVHLHFDKLLPQAEVRSYQPFQGRLAVRLKTECAVRVRIPDFVEAGALKAEMGGAVVPVRTWGNYAELGRHPAGTILTITYPLAARTEEMKEWVEYCNATDGQFAVLRRANGKRQPLNVRYWSIGNENWGGHEIGARTPQEWGPLVLDCAQQMRAVDPNLKLLAAATPDRGWTLTLLKAAGTQLDYVAIHEYWLPCWGENLTPDYLTCIMKSGGPEATIARVIKLIEEASCRGRIQIAFDEWNLRGWHHPGYPRKQVSGLRDPSVAELIRARDKNAPASQYTMADAYNDVEHPDRVLPNRTQLMFNQGVVNLAARSLTIVKVSLE
jgi:hypothetical protein